VCQYSIIFHNSTYPVSDVDCLADEMNKTIGLDSSINFYKDLCIIFSSVLDEI
jgi:hypothetical protein